jgi:adenosylhomocysteine nucleosidase
MTIGFMSAMPEELELALGQLPSEPMRAQEVGSRTYFSGRIFGEACVAVFSRWGKVAAATTATELISRFGAQTIVFTGVAGGIAPDLHIGDIVVGDELCQHDMDARPIFPRFEVPLTGKAMFATDLALRRRLQLAATEFLGSTRFESVRESLGGQSGNRTPRVVVGAIASGDRFIADARDVRRLRSEIRNVQCVEMEGAAVAQVCSDYAVPFGVIRTISDTADEHAPGSFQTFVRNVASHYSVGVLEHLMRTWSASDPLVPNGIVAVTSPRTAPAPPA